MRALFSSRNWILGNVAFFALAIFFGLPLLKNLESWVLPAVSNVQLISAEKVPGGQETWWRFSKRQCTYLGMSVSVRRSGGSLGRVLIKFLDQDENDPSRPPGENVAGPWVIQADAPPQMWVIHTRHRCHPLWDTVTQFWP